MQTNLGRARAAHDIAWADVTEQKVDMVVISEPNRSICRNKGLITDGNGNVALGIINRRIQIINITPKQNYIHVQLPQAHVYMIYISPNIPFDSYRVRIDEVLEDASQQIGEKILVGDVNAKSSLWGSPQQDLRGEYLEEWMAQLNWVAANNGEPTFIKGDSRSHIDVTLTTSSGIRKISNWEIRHDNPYTYHGHIYFDIRGDTRRANVGHNKKNFSMVRYADFWTRYRTSGV